ncbi:hypothetical protein Pcinc_000313 [Petrolisthes cinctipes]|uniref:Uncharacterized protein n=1 Tax=Petrolisthes cinctipes TaxID=88211 RepID=A0AAE1GPN0_PETCI|nr:hypothetical protein Pcinc_000509 [Petrolisthes cinctipes]KAK3896003.1 hypothetical protein Pcinc_000313 [Petrolisthes cinctipes]
MTTPLDTFIPTLPCFQFGPRPFISLMPSNHTTTDTEVRLAEDLPRRRKLGAILPALPKIQSSLSHRNWPRILPPTIEAFRTYSRGRCGTPSSFRLT